MATNSEGERSFASNVLDCVSDIPPGRVMSYGGVAAAVGSRAPRAVGRVLAQNGRSVPWHRVVRADGRPASRLSTRQLRLLADEGVPIEGGRVIMEWVEWSAPPGATYNRHRPEFRDGSETQSPRGDPR
jgi:methylated-DNA-protein-cysteine methyltransferase-like protein